MKNKILVVVLLSIIFIFVGCSFNEVEDITLRFYDGTTLIETSTLYKYNHDPFIPTKEGYEFQNWYLDIECKKPAVFSDIKSECSLYAGWTKKNDSSLFYHITFLSDDENIIKEMLINKIEDLVPPDAPNKDGYIFKGWDSIPKELNSDLTIHAVYAKLYSVEFYFESGDSVPISSQFVAEGENAVPPPNPTKNSDNQYSYSFGGWSASFEKVSADLKIYAVFTKHKNKYTYVFKNYDDSILYSKNADYGTKINPPTATKDSDETYVYTFIGWDLNKDGIPDALPETLSENFEAKALFQQNLKSFKVNFYVDDEIISSLDITYGDKVHFPFENPTKASTAQYHYEFIGWDKTFEYVTEDTDFYAVFNSVLRRYTYSFIDCTGTIFTETNDYGTTIVPPMPNGKEKDEQYEYPFSHWDGFSEGMILDADYTFEAVYTPQKRTFTYKFYVGKTIILSVTAEYGTVIVAPEPPESTDGTKFVMWIGFTEGMILTENIEFRARYV